MRKKLDNRIRTLIENSVGLNHRALFIIVGDKARDQVVILHHMLSKATMKQRPSVLWCFKKELGFSTHRKKRMKRLQKRLKSGGVDVNEDDPFELFVAATNIRWCYYAESHKILGQTFGMCVLQDFEALTPNLLARTVETVEGGGLVVLLLNSMHSLKQLYTMAMDVHNRYRTEAHRELVPRFNERFLLSLAHCSSALVLDDQLDILPISSRIAHIEPIARPAPDSVPARERDLRQLKQSVQDTPPLSSLVALCKTLDEATALIKLVDVLSERSGPRATCVLTSARGRGKSATLGLALAAALAFQYSNVFLSAPSPENLRTVFEFLVKGVDAMGYQEHLDYELIQSTNPEFNRAIIRVTVHRGATESSAGGGAPSAAVLQRRQTVQYLHPSDVARTGGGILQLAELVCIDEAAAVPLPLVKQFFGPYHLFLCSTTNGYEGTGRSLSLKLVQQLRQQANNARPASGSGSGKKETSDSAGRKQSAADTSAGGGGEGLVGASASAGGSRLLYELRLEESIRYSPGDAVELWLNELLLLDCCDIAEAARALTPVANAGAAAAGALGALGVARAGCPPLERCRLYYVNRDTLFSFHRLSELFLKQIFAIYVSSHYKNSPNDLQLLADAPAHHIFVLLGPTLPDQKTTFLPEVLCVLQVCLEGEISKNSILQSLSRGQRASGDLIPWTVSQQFCDDSFPQMSGARIIRIATNPDNQKMGYGSRALQLLQEYYELKYADLSEAPSATSAIIGASASAPAADGEHENADSALRSERVEPRADLPPLLQQLSEVPPPRAPALHYVGVAFGLTHDLFRFWKRAGYIPVYLRQTSNELTGEHTCIMIKTTLNDTLAHSGVAKWLLEYFKDFRRRIISLLSMAEFRQLKCSQALDLITHSCLQSAAPSSAAAEAEAEVAAAAEGSEQPRKEGAARTGLERATLEFYVSAYDLKRLEAYAQNIVDHHLVADLVPAVARIHFLELLTAPSTAATSDEPSSAPQLSVLQSAILLGVGLQHKSIEELQSELNLNPQQILPIFNRIVRKFVTYFNFVMERDVEQRLSKKNRVSDLLASSAKPLEPLSAEFEAAGAEVRSAYKRKAAEMSDDDEHESARDDEGHSGAAAAGDGDSGGAMSSKEAARQLDLHALFGEKTLAQYTVRGDEAQWKRATETLELSSSGRRLGARGGPSHVTLVSSAPASAGPLQSVTERHSSGKKSTKHNRPKKNSYKQHKSHK